MTINSYDVFAEFVHDLGSDYKIDAINDNGVAFYHKQRDHLKFSIVTAPMFGVEAGHVGFIVTKHAYPIVDAYIRLEDPELLDKIKERIEEWVQLLNI